jgi:hypothetical protein
MEFGSGKCGFITLDVTLFRQVVGPEVRLDELASELAMGITKRPTRTVSTGDEFGTYSMALKVEQARECPDAPVVENISLKAFEPGGQPAGPLADKTISIAAVEGFMSVSVCLGSLGA